MLGLVLLLSIAGTACGGESEPLLAGAEANVMAGEAPLAVDFTNLSTGADQYLWEFGDGGTLTTESASDPVSHTYTAPGTHLVTLTAVKAGEPPETSIFTIAITVVTGPLDSIVIDTSAVSLAPGESRKFSLRALDRAGNQLSLVEYEFHADELAGHVDDSGTFVAGRVAGTYPEGVVIEATQGSVSQTATVAVTVLTGPLVRAIIVPESVTLSVTDAKRFAVTAFDEFDNPIDGLSVKFRTAKRAGSISADGRYVAGFVAGVFPEGVTAQVTQGEQRISATAKVIVKPGGLAGLVFEPEEVTVDISGQVQFTARAVDRFGNLLPGNSPDYRADPNVGTMDAEGVFTAGTLAGTFTTSVVASLQTGSAVHTTTAVVTINPDPLHHVFLELSDGTVEVNSERTFIATPFDQFDNPITGLKARYWTDDAAGVIDGDGIFTAGRTAGLYEDAVFVEFLEGSVTAQASASVILLPGPLAAFRIELAKTTVPAGAQVQILPMGSDEFDNPILDLEISYQVIEGVGQVDAEGVFTASGLLGAHDSAITATARKTPLAQTSTAGLLNQTSSAEALNGAPNQTSTVDALGRPLFQSSTIDVIIEIGPLDHVKFETSSVALLIGESFDFNAVGFDQFENKIPGVFYRYSADPNSGQIDSVGRFTAGPGAGEHKDAVKVLALQGAITSTASADVTITHGPLAAVQVTPDNTNLAVNATTTFSAAAQDIHGNPIPEATVAWSANQTLGSIDAQGVLTSGTVFGSYVGGVVAVTTAGSISVTSTATVHVNSGVLDKVYVTPPDKTAVNMTQQLATTSTDPFGNQLIGVPVTWHLLDAKAGSLTPDGLFTASQAAGTYESAIRVVGTLGSTIRTATSTITVLAGPLEQVVVVPDPASISIGTTQQFVAVPADVYGNQITSGVSFSWNVVSSGGTIGSGGLFTAGTSPDTYEDTVSLRATQGEVLRTATATVTLQSDRIAYRSDRDDRVEIYFLEVQADVILRLTDEGGHNAEWSADGLRVVYDTGRNVVTVNENGFSRLSLVGGTNPATRPDWSPDGKKIVFRWNVNGQVDIYSMDSDGTNIAQLTNDIAVDDHPAWSPGGSKIAFVSNRDGDDEIFLMNVDGTSQEQITVNTIRDTGPDWSADGTLLVYQSDISGGSPGILVMNVDGTGAKVVSPTTLSSAECPSWSPDGTLIVFHGRAGGGFAHLYSVNPSDGGFTQYTGGLHNDECPRWAPRKVGVTVDTTSLKLPDLS